MGLDNPLAVDVDDRIQGVSPRNRQNRCLVAAQCPITNHKDVRHDPLENERRLAQDVLLSLTDHLLVGAPVQLAFEGFGGELAISKRVFLDFTWVFPPSAEISVYEYRKLKNGSALAVSNISTR